MRKFISDHFLSVLCWQIIATGFATRTLIVFVNAPDHSTEGSVFFLGGALAAALAIPVYMAYEWVFWKGPI